MRRLRFVDLRIPDIPWPVERPFCAYRDMPDHDRFFDAGTTLCGELALALRSELRQLQPGQVLEVVARDTAAHADLPAWCSITGHQMLRAEPPRYWIRHKTN